MNVYFRFRFIFGRKWSFIFVGISFPTENEKCFSVGLYSIHHKKVFKSLGLDLGYGLEIKLILVLKKVLITSLDIT